MPNSKGFEMGIAQECQNLALEQKLDKLIKKGWKPFGVEGIKKAEYKSGICERGENKIEKRWWTINFTNGVVAYPDGSGEWIFHTDNIRPIVSVESGLWQFCCKNRLTNRDEKSDWSKNAERDEDGVIDRDCLIFSSDYEYWIIESALKDESELEKFLLDNIKV